jgi:hypothetical protein
VVVALVVRMIATIIAEKAALKMKSQLGLPSVVLATLRAGKCERTALVVLIELGQAWKYAPAAFALEVIAFEVLYESGLIRAVEVTAWL